MDGVPRRQTSRVALTPLPDRRAESIRRVMENHILPGSTIWSDGHRSYQWLDNDPRYTHQVVVHAWGEFARMGPDGAIISTNAAEGLFSRCKTFLRTRRARKVAYGHYLAEFLWRSRFLSAARVGGKEWRRRATWELLRAMRCVMPPPATDHPWKVPEELQTSLADVRHKSSLHLRPHRGRFGKRRAQQGEAEFGPHTLPVGTCAGSRLAFTYPAGGSGALA